MGSAPAPRPLLALVRWGGIVPPRPVRPARGLVFRHPSAERVVDAPHPYGQVTARPRSATIANMDDLDHLLRDDQSRVWVAESDDVPGLATEAATLDELLTRQFAATRSRLVMKQTGLPKKF
jgi:hypothetical protein